MNREPAGSDFDAFLETGGLLTKCEAGAIKRVVARQIGQEMKPWNISRAKFVRCMKTNRATVDRLFSAQDSSVTLPLLEQAALALESKLKVEFDLTRRETTDTRIHAAPLVTLRVHRGVRKLWRPIATSPRSRASRPATPDTIVGDIVALSVGYDGIPPDWRKAKERLPPALYS